MKSFVKKTNDKNQYRKAHCTRNAKVIQQGKRTWSRSKNTMDWNMYKKRD